jgi:hypothetical protein
MQASLRGSWGPQILAYGHQHPWRVFAAMPVEGVVLDFGDGDGCGD